MAGRTQGQRAGLTRQAILDAALRLADREGLKALSMRRLGAELGVEAMTLYHHIPNKDALLDGLVEQVVTLAEAPRFGQGRWRDVLRDYARTLLDTLLAHPAVLPLVATRPATTPANLRMVEATLEALCRAGFTPDEALAVVHSLTGFVIGQATALAQAAHDDAQHTRGQLEHLSALDESEYPLLARAAREAGAARSRFDFALDAMLTGFDVALRRDSD